MRMVSLEFYDWRWRVWRRVRERVGEGRGERKKKMDRDQDEEECARVFYVTVQEWI